MTEQKLDPVRTAQYIQKAIDALTLEGKRSLELIQVKADTAGEYDKTLSVAITTLKAEGMSISIIDKLAKGRVSDLLIKKIVAEEILKAHYCRMDTLKAQLNGLQSINRHLEYSTR